MLYYLLISFLSALPTHDVQIAIFKIHEDEKNILVEFVFERDDIQQTLKVLGKNLTKEKLQEYITDNFSITHNQLERKISFGQWQIKDKHIYLKGKYPKSKMQLQSIEIKNTCLLEIENHSNIIEMRLNNQERDFLMTVDRTSIEIEY